MRRSGLTLIELLVVLAIISILATLGMVNYQYSITRTKVAAAQNDMRVLALALESYALDNHAYPPSTGVGANVNPWGGLISPVSLRLIPLTTPISYITTKPNDPMRPGSAFWNDGTYDTYDYLDPKSVAEKGGCGLTSGAEWRVCSAGPDGYQMFGGRTANEREFGAKGVNYDATNGTRSTGDVVRVGPPSTIGGDPTDPTNPNRPGNLRIPNYLEQWRNPQG